MGIITKSSMIQKSKELMNKKECLKERIIEISSHFSIIKNT